MDNSLADSDSIKMDSILVPHSNAISILTYLLNLNISSDIHWIDLACGKGQILTQLRDNLDNNYRHRIKISLIDLNNESLRIATDIAEKLGFGGVTQKVSDLYSYCNTGLIENSFEYITLINTLHEIKPKELGLLIIKCIVALKDNGVFYIFDQEELPVKELGATTWSSIEISNVLNDYFDKCAIDYRVYANKWNHKTVSSWSLQIQKTNILNTNNLKLLSNQAVLESLIQKALILKADINKKALTSLTKFGGSTENEDENKIENLYDYWALTKALEEFK